MRWTHWNDLDDGNFFDDYPSRTYESVLFQRDDMGNWFACTNNMMPGYTARCAYFVPDANTHEMLEAVLEDARGRHERDDRA